MRGGITLDEAYNLTYEDKHVSWRYNKRKFRNN